MNSSVTTTGLAPAVRTDSPPPLPVILLDWVPIQRPGSLRGFAKAKIRAQTIPNIPVHSQGGKSWAAIPGKAVVSNGQHLKDAAGKYRWEPIFELTTLARQAFSAGVVTAVLAEYPHALDDAS